MTFRLFTAMLLAGAALYSCGSDETPLHSGGENDDPSDGGAGSPLSGFDIPAELSQWTGLNPMEGSGYTLRGFPEFLVTIGGPGKDGIPALNNPPFVAPEEVSYVQDDQLVLGLVVDGVARAYPHNIGWWHEIVNDEIAGHFVSVTFCPLTGTGLAFEVADRGHFELGVSGLIYNSNLIMYDRRDGKSLYAQMYFTAFQGSRRGESLRLLPITETTLGTWKRLHPDTEVIALGSGTFDESLYAKYPYGSYRTDNRLRSSLDPVMNRNSNPFAGDHGWKELTLGVRLNGEPKAYVFEDLGERIAINDHLGGEDILVVWDRDSQLALPYWRQVDGQSLTFTLDPDVGFPFSLVDEETGSRWDILGVATEGPLAGKRLVQIPAHNSFWFAWVTFWLETDKWTP